MFAARHALTYRIGRAVTKNTSSQAAFAELLTAKPAADGPSVAERSKEVIFAVGDPLRLSRFILGSVQWIIQLLVRRTYMDRQVLAVRVQDPLVLLAELGDDP
jgi:hypothetical protein